MKSKKVLKKAVDAVMGANSVIFDSRITNEEAIILQKLKEKLGCRLVNHDAFSYQEFLNAYASTSGKSLYNGTLSDVVNSDAIIVMGTRINDDSDKVKCQITKASKNNLARVIYMHTLEDMSMQNLITQFIKYEVGSEEAVVALLVERLLGRKDIQKELAEVLSELDIGNLSAESNVGEEELDLLKSSLDRKKSISLIVGADMYTHPRAENIAKLLGLLQRHTEMFILLVPANINSLGVSLICDLDKECEKYSVGYNVDADFVLSCSGDGDMNMPAFNQQEGTFTSMDKEVLPTSVALDYEGYCLNDIANEIGINAKYTTSYTKELPMDKGYKFVEFDSLPDYNELTGEKHLGYKLDVMDINIKAFIEDVEELDIYDGVVVYNCNDKNELGDWLSSTSKKNSWFLLGSKQFSVASKLVDGDVINFEIDGVLFNRIFKVVESLKGTVAINPVFDIGLSRGVLHSYRFSKLKFKKVES